MSFYYGGGSGSGGGSSSTAKALGKPQVVTGRNKAITSNRQGTNGGSFTRLEARIKMYVGPQAAVNNFQFGMAGYQMNVNAVGESAFANPYTSEFAMELLSPVCDRYAQFGNSGNPGEVNVTTITPGSSITLCDSIPYDIAAGGGFWLRYGETVTAAALYFPLGGAMASGDFNAISASSTSQVDGTGSMTVPSGGGIPGSCYPFITLGQPLTPMPACGIHGDSIGFGQNDGVASATGAIGYIEKGFDNAGATGIVCPWQNQSMPSMYMTGFTKALSPRGRDVWQYLTHILVQLGTNDLAVEGISFATLQAQLIEILTAAKRTLSPYGKPLQTSAACIIPRATSTDNYATEANQTTVWGSSTTGARAQYNAYLHSIAGQGLLDTVIDANPAIESTTNYGCWKATGVAQYYTNDGAHPNAPACAIMAPYVRSVVSAFAP